MSKPTNNQHGLSVSQSQIQAEKRFLITVFVGAIGLLLVSTMVTYRVGRMALDAQSRMANQLMILKQLPDLISVVGDAETGQRGFLLTGDPAYLQPYEQAIIRLDSQLASMKELADRGEIASEHLRALGDSIHLKMAELKETIDARRDNGLQEALVIVRSNRGKQLMDDIRRRVEEMRSKAQSDYDAAGITFTRSTNFRTTTFIVSALLNIGFLTWFYRRIARQDWLRAGQMRLNESISGEKSLSGLGESVLKLLAEYLGAEAGAIFVEENGSFRRIAMYAVPASAQLPERFNPGEGLLGQAVKDARGFLVKDVPEDYLKIGSGLGQTSPRHLLIAPMKVDDELNAVLELDSSRRHRKRLWS